MNMLNVMLVITIFFNCAFRTTIISKEIESVINKIDPNINIGIQVQNLKTEQVVYSKNSQRYFIPGSVLKFMMIVSFLEYFGTNYLFNSRVLKQGNNYFIDIHHPDFTYDELKTMINKMLTDREGKAINNIFIIHKEFSVPSIMNEKTISDTMTCHGAPVTKVHVDNNCTKINVAPGDIGEKVIVMQNRSFPYIIYNNAITSGKNTFHRPDITLSGSKCVIQGNLSSSYKMLTISAVTNSNFSNIIQHVKQHLLIKKVKIQGDVTVTKVIPSSPKIIYSNVIPYKDVARKAMKLSDNFITDYLLAEYITQRKLFKWGDGIISIKSFIKKKFNVDLKKSEIHDASGISRRNLLTVEQISNFLISVYKYKNYQLVKMLMASPGDESTLRNRFKGVKSLYTKTGTLRNVSSLIGYFIAKSGKEYSFVIMANNFYINNNLYRDLEEKIVRLLIDQL